jgi:hypothetical protein
MGFFDRFFGKKKEEPPRTPPPAYVPPEPPPLPATPTPRLEPKEEVAAPPPSVVEQQRYETTAPVAQPTAKAPTTVDETPPQDTISEEVEEAASPNILAEDFSELTEQTATAVSADLPQAEVAAEAPAAEIETYVGVGARLEVAPAGTLGPDLADSASTALADSASTAEEETEEIDFDIPTTSTGSDQLNGQTEFLAADDDLEGFDAAFERILVQDGTEIFGEDAEPAVTTDQTEVRTLFSEIAAHYIRPVKAFIIELRTGAARKEWLEMCQPAISSLGKSALGMGMEDVSDAVHEFENLLAEARASQEGVVSGELRERILQHYQTLTEMLPATFVIDDTTLQSEGMIVNSLLKQIPEVGKVTIDKLYRAGLITIESFLVGAKEDLAIATGLPIWLAEKIIEKFKSYQQQLESGLAQGGKEGLLNRLEQLVRDLRDAHEAYEIATAEEASNPSAVEDRRFYRQARQEAQLQINVLLAELGAVELANEIQRLSFEKRVERLQRFIADERRA